MTDATRVRLYGGRHTHAARPGYITGHITLCGQITSNRDHWMPDTAHVTCPKCRRKTA